jgi:hypothetical protein
MLAIRTVLGASLVLAMSALGIAACSDDDTKPPVEQEHEHEYCDLPPVCQEILVACHAKDLGDPGEVHECHETAHDVGTEAGCEAVHDECIELCDDTPLPPGTPPYVPEHCGDGGHDH